VAHKRRGQLAVPCEWAKHVTVGPRSVKELKGFEKIALQLNEEKTVTFTIDKSALRFFDATKNGWVAEPGDFTALVGATSDDIRTKILFTLN
jgi:beta-glucosidase